MSKVPKRGRGRPPRKAAALDTTKDDDIEEELEKELEDKRVSALEDEEE